MFGYIKCYKDELKVKNAKRYEVYYCGICSRIQHQWGFLFRISLSYDATFLGVFLDGFSKKTENHRIYCPLMPFGRNKVLQSNISMLDYAALINGYLFIKKLEDNYLDDKNWLCGILAFFLKKTTRYRKFQKDYEKLFLRLENHYIQYMYAEKNKLYSTIDEYSGLFGDFLGEVYQGISEYSPEYYKDEEIKQNLFVFGKILGMWIYTIDALDDYKTDKKRYKFNPLIYMEEDMNILLVKVEKMLMLMQADLFTIFKKMGVNINGEIVENVLSYGMQQSMRKIIENWKEEKNGDK